MTSNHLDAQPQTSILYQSSSKYDEVERVRQRMSDLRKHHNESEEIYNKTQPGIVEEIRQETIKYLKDKQVNGTKTKSQKLRAPKKQRRAVNDINDDVIDHPAGAQASPVSINITNGPQPLPHIHQAPPSSQTMIQQQGHSQQITLYPPQVQQQTMHLQSHQMQAQQPHYAIYQQSQQSTMQTQQYLAQEYQPQRMYHQQQQMQSSSHVNPRQVDRGDFVPQTNLGIQSHFAQYQNGRQYPHQHHYQESHTFLPKDLDLTLQSGLECDVDSLIKLEMSVEGQLDFNHELLTKLTSINKDDQVDMQKSYWSQKNTGFSTVI